jgi:ubiquinone biosynthesis accessory factor UbiJ
MNVSIALFNHLLAQQPEVRAGLAELAGRRVALVLAPLRFCGVLTEDSWLAESPGEPEATLRIAPLAALTAQLTGRPPGFDSLTQEGDRPLAQALSHRVAALRWLPVEDLSRLVGDVAAHRIEGLVRGVVGVKGQIAWRLADNWFEHLREEAPLLARSNEIRYFITAVDMLRDDAERLEKRLRRIETTRGQQHG